MGARRFRQGLAAALAGLCLCSMSGCDQEQMESYLLELLVQTLNENMKPAQGSCIVYFLDIGQGDSTLIVTDKAAVLIDAGEQSAGETVLQDLRTYGVSRLDYVIATHPHSDHIGGLPVVLNYAAQHDDLSVEHIIVPELPEKMTPTSRIYEKFLDSVAANGLSLTPAQNVTYDLGSASLEILPAPGSSYSDLNDFSVCAHLLCGETGFFFTGDCSKPEEGDLVNSGALDLLDVDVLKVGHHGSRESSSDAFLAALTPEYAVISCGIDNSYKHPHKEAVSRLEKYCGDRIWRTDENGIVAISTDGREISVAVEKQSN